MGAFKLAIDERGVAAVVFDLADEKVNKLSAAVLAEFSNVLGELERNRSVRLLTLRSGKKGIFIAGADIAELALKTPLEARAYGELGQDIAHRLETMRKPSIAAVNGFALGGGCEIALACDIRLCSEKAVFGQPEVKLGIMPGWGGTQRLARTTSLGFAKEVILTGRNVPAEEAYRRGLVQAIHPQAELVPKAMEMAAQIASMSPVAISYAKEGLNAFTEKRRPTFIGK